MQRGKSVYPHATKNTVLPFRMGRQSIFSLAAVGFSPPSEEDTELHRLFLGGSLLPGRPDVSFALGNARDRIAFVVERSDRAG